MNSCHLIHFVYASMNSCHLIHFVYVSMNSCHLIHFVYASMNSCHLIHFVYASMNSCHLIHFVYASTGYRNGSIYLCIHENTIFTQTTKIGIHEFKYIHSIYIYIYVGSIRIMTIF
jgi:hypothetical protein